MQDPGPGGGQTPPGGVPRPPPAQQPMPGEYASPPRGTAPGWGSANASGSGAAPAPGSAFGSSFGGGGQTRPREAAAAPAARARSGQPSSGAPVAAKVALLVAAILLLGVGAFFLVTWQSATAYAFVLEDMKTGQRVSGSPLTVVIQVYRKPDETIAARAAVLQPDVYGRYEPLPDMPGMRSEIWVWHVAYKPVAHARPAEGVIRLEDHGGAPTPEIEAQLRGLGEIEPTVGAALKAGFLRGGPSVRYLGPPLTASPATASRPPDAGAPPTHVEDADRIARAIAAAAASAGPDRDRPFAKIDEYIASAPRDARLRGSTALERAIAAHLAGEADPELMPRLVTLAGALWHGTGTAPAAFGGLSGVFARWSPAARDALAVACARIGGPLAAREIASLVRRGTIVAEEGAWLETAARLKTLPALATALADARKTAGGDERARIDAAAKAVERRRAESVPSGS